MTKLRSLITEQTFSKYEEFLAALLEAKRSGNFQLFERIITDSLKTKKWELFERFYQSQDKKKTLTKAIFKETAPF